MPLLLCDLDNTLLDREAAFRSWACEFLERIGAPDDIDWLLDLDADGLTDRWDVAEGIQDRYRLGNSAIDVVDEIREGLLAHLRLDPMVAFALKITGDAGWLPVVVTNGDAGHQEAKIRKTGLDRYVADWVISGEAGVSKPNPRIFEIAAYRVRANLRGAWLIGDSPEADIGGAAELGVPCVWLHRGRRWTERRFGPTATADGPIEALAMVMDHAW